MSNSPRKRNYNWVPIAFILSPIIWTIPTFFILRAQTDSKNAACESSMKSHGLNLLFYAKNHDDVLPNAKNWIQASRAGEDEPLKCPADPDKARLVSYAMNANLSGKKLSDIKNPSQVILLYETNAKGSTPFGTGKDMVDIGKEKAGQGRHNLVAYRFNFFLMADGTVRRAGTHEERKPLRWTP